MTMGASKVRRQSAILDASKAAEESKLKAKAKDAKDFVRIAKASMEFKIMSIQAELDMLNQLTDLNEDEEVDTLFFLLDKEHKGELRVSEICDGLRRVQGDDSFEVIIEKALDSIANTAEGENAILKSGDFQAYITSLAKAMECSVHDIAELLTMTVVFTDSRQSSFENFLETAEGDNKAKVMEEKKEEEYKKALVDGRMKALFGLFDVDGDGSVDFKEVVLGMYKITENIDGASKAALNALIMFDKNSGRTLDLNAFTQFMINVVAASPENVTFDDVADTLTKQASQDIKLTPEQMEELFSMDQSLKAVMSLDDATQAEVDGVDAFQYGRVKRLFDIWDLNNDGYISFHELALGLRKFEETTTLNVTVEESIKVLNAFDTDSDQQLDPKEFALFITKFTSTCGADFHQMLDFMIVASALKENSEAEQKYIQSIGASDIYYWGC